MRKRITVFVVLMMVLCLSLAGCAQRDNHAGATSNEPASESHDSGIGNPDNSESGELDSDVEPIGDDDGSYTYNVSGTDFTCKHNIDDYIVEKDGKLVFNLRALARDIGWKYAGPQDAALVKQTVFIPCDETYGSDTVQVKFEEEDPYTTIYYVYSTGSSHSTKVQFVRSDLVSRSAETSRTYYVNSALNGKTISRDMAVMFCYLLENISINTGVNPLEEIYSSNGPYNL